MQIGKEIKRKRVAKGLTLKALSEKTGLSVGFISNIERDINSPTISSLQKICDALDVDIAEIFHPTPPTTIVFRREECAHLNMPESTRAFYELYPLNHRKLQPSYISIDPGGCYGEPALVHREEEIGIVISGEIEITAGDSIYCLKERDCIYIEPGVPHKLRNTSDKRVETIWVTLR